MGADRESSGKAEDAEVPLGEHKGVMLERLKEVFGNLSCPLLDLVDS